MSYATEGFEFCRGVISPATIDRIRGEMVAIMRPFCDARVTGPADLDEAFAQVTRQSRLLRGNVLKTCGRLASLPLLLAEPGVRDMVAKVGIKVPVIQAYSVLCMEPFEKKFLFEPHQDLKQRISLKALAFWVPLSGGADIGGLGVLPRSHAAGPRKHTLSPAGHVMLPAESYAEFTPFELTDYREGDCLFFSPYLIHWSIQNKGKCNRWTVSLKVDEASEAMHLPKSIHPFVIEEYVDTRSNEERLAAAAKARA